jgi:ketosteroid isomerase-like protein
VSLLEAATVVERFRHAFEARDPDQLATLFASDAAENGREGRDAIASAYRTQLAALEGVRYELPELAIAPHGDRIEVRAPFVISYRAPTGGAGEIRGRAEWAVERRDGHPLIVSFDYRVDPTLPR